MLHILIGDAVGDVALILKAAKNGEAVSWIVPKNAKPNERALFYLPRLGLAARGIVESEPHKDEPGRYGAVVGAITMLSSAVPLAFISKNQPQWGWPTYPRHYVTIEGAAEKRLEELLDSYQASLAESLIEGASKTISVVRHERNPIARQECIAHYGTFCFACGFSFGDAYGETAEGFIHVHHLKNLANKGGEHKVNPIKDLRPICPNCHAVIHLQDPPLSIAELKLMLKQARSAVKL